MGDLRVHTSIWIVEMPITYENYLDLLRYLANSSVLLHLRKFYEKSGYCNPPADWLSSDTLILFPDQSCQQYRNTECSDTAQRTSRMSLSPPSTPTDSTLYH
jgi:hypothetical protein